MKKPVLLIVLMMIVLSFVACASKAAPKPMAPFAMATGGVDFARQQAMEAAPAAPVPEADYAPKAAPESAPDKAVKRLVIKNVQMSVVAEDPVKSMKEFGTLADKLGGFVVESAQYKQKLADGKEVPQGTMTIRVPADKLEEVLEKIKGSVDEVRSENISGQDVTQEYTDLQSRLRNLEAAEKELQRIMEQAFNTEDVMNVYNQLVQIREQIEVVKGQIQYYENSAALSAIRIELIAKASVQPVTVGGWQPVGVARDAVQALIEAMKGLVNVTIWLTIFFLPLLIIVVIPFAIIYLIVRRIWKRRKQSKALQAVSETKKEEKPS